MRYEKRLFYLSGSREGDERTTSGVAIGQYSRSPEILARFVFFEQFKQLVPEAFDDLKKSSFDYQQKICYLIVGRGMKLDDSLEAEPIEYRNMRREFLLNSRALEDDASRDLERKYHQSLEEWGRRWDLGEEQWEREQGWITGQAFREIRSMLDPALLSLYSEYDATERFFAERKRIARGECLGSREQARHMFSPKEMEKMYGSEWRKVVERNGETWEETVELMCIPTADDDPTLFQKLYNKLINMLPDKHVIILPDGMELVFSDKGWNPSTETRSDAAKRIKADFERRLDAYLDLKDSEAREQGLQPVSKSLRQKLPTERDRFEWLIRYQVQAWSKSKIAKHYGVDRNAVQESLKTEASLIGLKLRVTESAALNQ